MHEIWTFITEQLQSNQFLAGGFVLGALATVVHHCKKVPERIWNWIKRRFIIEVDIPDRDEAFLWLNKWLAMHPYGAKRARLLTVRTERPESSAPTVVGEISTSQPKIIFSPAAGHHWFMYRGRPVTLYRERKDSSEQRAGTNMFGIRETFTLKMLTRNRQRIIDLLEEARDLVHPKTEKRFSVMVARYGDWETSNRRRPRPLGSVVLKAGIMEQLVSQIETFMSREQWYVDRGIPYRLSILLKGPPGSGKSSAVAAIASHFNMDVGILNLNAGSLDDNELRNLLSDIPKDMMVLIEDIDCVFDQREADEDKQSKVTFSGLLNAIDGVAAGEGRILFMTTNHPEKLDPALIRPGRADIRIEIGAPDAGQASRMFERFFPEATNSQNLRFIEALPLSKTSMAAIQGHLTKYSDDAEKAIRHAGEAVIQPEKQL